MSTTRELLKEAYRLIRRDQPEMARDILRPILEEEPDNAHAWWLLAYSVDDPHEVRDALKKVLEIDPDYTNADKAREMLAALEEQYFSGAAQEADTLFDDDLGMGGTDDVLGDTFGAAEDEESYESYDSTFFEEDDPLLDDLDDDLLGARDSMAEADTLSPTFETDDTLAEDDLDDLFRTDDLMTDEVAQAEAEEKAGRTGGGRRVLRLAVVLLLLAVVVIGVWFVFVREDNATEDDPGALEAEETNAEMDAAIARAQTQLVAAGLGSEPQALVSSTTLGNTLFLSFCREPSRTLPQDVNAAMAIAVQEAANAPAGIAAVGVSISRCNVDPHDTLYRAFVSVENAQRYLNDDFGTDADGWAAFQATWKKP